MAKANRKNIKYPEIVKMFDSLSGSKGTWEVWNDVIKMMAVSIANTCDGNLERKKQREKQYLDISNKYSSDEIQIAVKIVAAITNALEENPEQDLLGDLYMSLDFGSNALGQFFTPYCVCQAMAALSVDKALMKSEIAKNGYIRVNEPACGAGANIIAFINKMKSQGLNYQSDAFIVAQDLSQLTAMMCYVQMSLLGCAGIVVVGDTLKSPCAKTQTEIEIADNIWLTPMYCNEIWCIRRNAKLFDEILVRGGKDNDTAKIEKV